jgi:hypothetical protein
MSKVYIVTEEPYHDNSYITSVHSSLEGALGAIPAHFIRQENNFYGEGVIWFKPKDPRTTDNEFHITERELHE